MKIEVLPIQEEHLDEVAALVERRYKVLRKTFPYLPERLKKADTLTKELGSLIQKGPGVAAFREGKIVGYLTGMLLPQFLGKRTIYSPEWANSAELENSPQIYQEMYRHIAREWVADGCLAHVLTMMGGDSQGLNAWQWMGFGLVAVDGLRKAQAFGGANPGKNMRPAGMEDAIRLEPLLEKLAQHLASAPTFWVHELENPADWLAHPGQHFWIAEEGEQVVACMGLKAGCLGGVDFFDDEKAISVEHVFTIEERRGRGIAAALLNRCLGWANEQGYRCCGVDFESANVTAARFWLRWFQPFCYSLMRSIDERVADGLR